MVPKQGEPVENVTKPCQGEAIVLLDIESYRLKLALRHLAIGDELLGHYPVTVSVANIN